MNEHLDSIASLYKIEAELLEIENYIKQSSEINNILGCYNNIKQNNQNLYDIKQDIKQLYQEYFTISNILYYPLNISKWKFKSKKQLANLQTKETISPFDIPITNYEIISEIGGIVHGGNSTHNNTPVRLVKSISITNCDISKEIYAHEIAHTQQLTEDHTLNYFNEEVLSIFLERLAQDYFNKDNKMIYFRLNDLLTKINILKKIGYTDDEVRIYQKLRSLVYIESTLKAYLLYHLYQTESLSSTKARIIDEINQVFNKQQTTEEILNNHGITKENYKTEFTKILVRR